MKDTTLLANEDILGLISQNYVDRFCVFIQPGGIIDPEKLIRDLKLECDCADLMAETLIMEHYEDREAARQRVFEFAKDYETRLHFYVSCYKDGEFIVENSEGGIAHESISPS